MTVKEMLKLPRQEFQQNLPDLVKHTERPLKAYVTVLSRDSTDQIEAQMAARGERLQLGKRWRPPEFVNFGHCYAFSFASASKIGGLLGI